MAAVRAAQLGPKDALTRDTIGVVFTRLGDHDAAVALFEDAVTSNPDHAEYQYNLASSRQFAGNFDGAKQAYRRAIALDPGLYKAWSALISLEKQTVENEQIDTLSQAFDQSGTDEDRRLHLGHALAKTCEDLGDHTASLEWLGRAKAARQMSLDYKSAADEAVFEAAKQTPGEGAAGYSSERPIFVVGLPRTGTTLVERILSSHSDVDSVGELANFSTLCKQMTGTPGNLVMDAPTLRAAGSADMTSLGKAYEDSAAHLFGDAPRFVDKMPLNILYAGLILKALPNARIVCVRRHPMDACLSNYRQLFATSFSYYNYAYDLDDCGRYYLLFDQLCAHWRASFPADRYMEICYEDVIADQEGETRRLLSHCGLDWQEACLDFHNQTGAVATASSVQVRQPLYSSSIGRWKRHGTALDSLRAVLTQGGVLDDAGEWLRG
ncbi:MAG: sulfotransferase [Maricaulis sp.]|nr:sulfotransferase [Maricaulis sp.]